MSSSCSAVRVAVLASLACGACSYSPSTLDDTPTDGSTTPDGDAPPDTPTNLACSAVDATGIVLCLELDDDVTDGTLTDGSPGHHDATTTGLSPATRTLPTNSPAAQIGASSVTRVPEDPVLDRDTGYTMAVWVHPDSLPVTGDVFGILDHEDQYAMLIGHSSGESIRNRCVHTGVARYEYTENLPANAWSFLACTWDGTDFCAYRWSADGDHEHFCHRPTLLPNATGSRGLAIGHLSDMGAAQFRFDGALDSIQLYDHGLSEDQLCAQIGKGAGCMPCTVCEQ